MQEYDRLGVFYLGGLYDVTSKSRLGDLLLYDPKDLVTHAVCIGMTGSGKTGLCISLIEEAAIDGVPAIVIDPKGDITNLLLTFPDLRGQDFLPWINQGDALKKGLSPQEFADQQAALWREGLMSWGQDGKRIQRLRDSADFAIYTPGSNAGLQVSILESFAAPLPEIRQDEELLQERVVTATTGLLALLGIDVDPIRSREHILISSILAESWRRSENLDLGGLIQLIQSPPFSRIGVLDLESFYPLKDRFELAMQLNNLLAAPGFGLWLEGETMDVGGLLHSPTGKPKVSIFCISHLNDAQRMFFVSLLLNEVVGWMRAQSGTTSLRAVLYIDEVFGYLPPSANPPSKLPLMTLLKQARATGLGVVLSTQNPVDLDYKALSNAGTWFLGRLQTERDKERVLDGLEGTAVAGQERFSRRALGQVLSGLGSRVFLMNNVHEDSPVVFQTRWAMSYLRGPLTREQIKLLVESTREGERAVAQPPGPEPPPVPPAPRAAPAGTPAKPMVPPGVPEYFLPHKADPRQWGNPVYRPLVVGAARVRFRDRKAKIDIEHERVFITPVGDGPVPLNWDDSEETSMDISDLQVAPVTGIPYVELPSAALRAGNYSLWEKDFSDWLYRTQRILLRRSPQLNELSRPGETERDFRIRLQQIARERRDQQVEKLREKYAKTFARLDERIRRAQAALEEQKAQARGQKYQAAVSIGESLLGSFLGRKSSTRATRATRDISRTMKESRDGEMAEQNLKALQQERERMEESLRSEVDKVESKEDALVETLEEVPVAPTKANILVRLVALVWTTR